MSLCGGVSKTRSDARGEYLLPVTPGPQDVQIGRDGFLPAWRRMEAADGVGTVALDARLLPVDSVAVSVGASGGSVGSSTAGYALDVPAGALSGTREFRLTAVPPLALAQVLAPGWSPWGAADVQPWDAAFAVAARLTAPWVLPGDSEGRAWMLLRFDPSSREWQRVEPLSLVVSPKISADSPIHPFTP